MFGLRLQWKCNKCDAVMNYAISRATMFKVYGEGRFIKMSCSECKQAHFVGIDNGNVVVNAEDANAEEVGVFCF